MLSLMLSHSCLGKGLPAELSQMGMNGFFLIFYLNENGTYAKSPTIKIQDTYPYGVISPGPDIVAGILAHWVCRRALSFL